MIRVSRSGIGSSKAIESCAIKAAVLRSTKTLKSGQSIVLPGRHSFSGGGSFVKTKYDQIDAMQQESSK